MPAITVGRRNAVSGERRIASGEVFERNAVCEAAERRRVIAIPLVQIEPDFLREAHAVVYSVGFEQFDCGNIVGMCECVARADPAQMFAAVVRGAVTAVIDRFVEYRRRRVGDAALDRVRTTESV